MGLREETQIRCPSHLAWVRGHECCAETGLCFGKIEAAHVRTGTDGGMGVKPGDNWTIPLCAGHHRIQHDLGETSFESQYLINMKTIAEGLWLKSPHGKKWRATHE